MEKKRGRPKGSNCLVSVSLRDLNRYLKEDATVSVSKKYLETIGYQIAAPNLERAPKAQDVPAPKITTF